MNRRVAVRVASLASAAGVLGLLLLHLVMMGKPAADPSGAPREIPGPTSPTVLRGGRPHGASDIQARGGAGVSWIRLMARDLGTGSPVSDLPLAASGNRGQAQLEVAGVTDSSGTIEFALDGMTALRVNSPVWHGLADQRMAEVLRAHEFWVYSNAGSRQDSRGGGQQGSRRLVGRPEASRRPELQSGLPDSPQWTRLGLIERGLGDDAFVDPIAHGPEVDAFHAEVPRVRWLSIMAGPRISDDKQSSSRHRAWSAS